MDSFHIIEDQLDTLLAREVDRAALQWAERAGVPTALADVTDQLGLSRALLPESDDGAGLSWREAGRLFGLLGRRLCPVPIGEDIIARRILHDAGLKAPDARLTFHPGGALKLQAGHVSGVLSGVVIDPAAPALIVTVAVAEDGSHHLVLIEAAAALRQALASIGREPRQQCVFEAARPLCAAATGPDAPDRLLSLGAMLRSSQIAGALRSILDLSVDYANTRQQFGRPIGKFQAIQQSLAVLAAETAAAEMAAAMAWSAWDCGRLAAAAVAKIRTAQAARIGAAVAHQVHGAIGVTDEHMLHYFTRRLWTWRSEFGTEQDWSERLGRTFLDRPDAGLWTILTEELTA